MAGFEGPSGTDSCEKCAPGKYKVNLCGPHSPAALAELPYLAGLNEGGQAMPTALWPFEELLHASRTFTPSPFYFVSLLLHA